MVMKGPGELSHPDEVVEKCPIAGMLTDVPTCVAAAAYVARASIATSAGATYRWRIIFQYRVIRPD